MSIILKKLRKVYKLSQEVEAIALNGVSFELGQGEFCAVVGPSGSGKTTLFNVLGCIDKPDEGTYYFDDQEVTCLKEGELINIRRKMIGYVFQFFNLIPTLTAFENAELPFWNTEAKNKQLLGDNLKRLFVDLGIADLGGRYPKQLSGGQEQRVAIARALANRPRLVLADEPTGNLDSKTAREIIELMRQESRALQASFLVATHDFSLLKYFDRIIFLKDGKIEKIEVKNDQVN